MEFAFPTRPEDLLAEGEGLTVQDAANLSEMSSESITEIAEGKSVKQYVSQQSQRSFIPCDSSCPSQVSHMTSARTMHCVSLSSISLTGYIPC